MRPVEVPRLFEEQPMNRAVRTIFDGKVIDTNVGSDFGKAAERFRNEYLPTIGRFAPGSRE